MLAGYCLACQKRIESSRRDVTCSLIHTNDHIKTNTHTHTHIKVVVESGVIPKLVPLLSHKENRIVVS